MSTQPDLRLAGSWRSSRPEPEAECSIGWLERAGLSFLLPWVSYSVIGAVALAAAASVPEASVL